MLTKVDTENDYRNKSGLCQIHARDHVSKVVQYRLNDGTMPHN
jgi:hypothetical protein